MSNVICLDIDRAKECLTLCRIGICVYIVYIVYKYVCMCIPFSLYTKPTLADVDEAAGDTGPPVLSNSWSDALIDNCVADRITSGRLLSGSFTGSSTLYSSLANGDDGRAKTTLSLSSITDPDGRRLGDPVAIELRLGV